MSRCREAERSKAWVLLSGGIDSAACVELYRSQDFSVETIHVQYGQVSAERERVAASKISDYYRVPMRTLTVSGGQRKDPGEIIGRNALLLFVALLELPRRPGLLITGVHSGTTYYDCDGSFFSNVQAILDGYTDGSIRIGTPFVTWSKKEIFDFCVERDVPLKLTYSCEAGTVPPCGSCLSCRDRLELNAV